MFVDIGNRRLENCIYEMNNAGFTVTKSEVVEGKLRLHYEKSVPVYMEISQRYSDNFMVESEKIKEISKQSSIRKLWNFFKHH